VVIPTSALQLVRHGESGWNAERRVQGQSAHAPALTPLGRAQARTAAELLAELAPHARLVVSSDLPRARETALVVALALGLPLRCDPTLRELCLGELEGRRLDDPGEGGGTVAEAVAALWREPWRRPPGGESVGDLHRRIHAALGRLADGAAAGLIVVTHGGPIRVATAASVTAVRHLPVGNASVTTLAVPAPPAAEWWGRRAS
jgi:broad specificity phosphatase PhoE